MMVALNDVSKVYVRGSDRICGLDRVNLEVEEGDFCAFVGPSGCGKSTLLNLIAGLDHPTSGDVLIAGRSTKYFTSHDWTSVRRHSIGIIFQAFHLIPGLSVEENVAFPLLLRGDPSSEIEIRVTDALGLVGITHRKTHRPSELSGGEQQRAAIARAIVHRPKILLADEPTGNLDSHYGAEIISLLRRLVKEFGHTVLLVTHSIAAAESADYIWTMQDGRLMTRAVRTSLSQA